MRYRKKHNFNYDLLWPSKDKIKAFNKAKKTISKIIAESLARSVKNTVASKQLNFSPGGTVLGGSSENTAASKKMTVEEAGNAYSRIANTNPITPPITPSKPKIGETFYNTTTQETYVFDGMKWVDERSYDLYRSTIGNKTKKKNKIKKKEKICQNLQTEEKEKLKRKIDL